MLLGGNSFFIEDGEGTCKIKSNGHNDVKDSDGGFIEVNLDPSNEYSEDIVIECTEGETKKETNSFKIEVKCRSDVTNFEFDEVIDNYAR